MKRYVAFLFLIFSFLFVTAQIPNGFNYQAVVRNSSGEVVANSPVSFRISILQNSETDSVYSETHSVSTNDFGLANLKIGSGDNQTGVFYVGDWRIGPRFIKVEIDVNGGSSFLHMGTMQLLSVPYAFHAQTVEEDQVDDADADPTNEIQSLGISGSDLSISDGNTITLPLGEGGDNWGTQVVITNSTLTGNGTANNPLNISGDLSDDQQLSINGHDLSITDGNTVTLPDEIDDADADPTNEIQSLGISGSDLSISDGNTITLPLGEGGDNWGTQAAQTDETINGDGSPTNPLGVNHGELMPDWNNIQGMPVDFADNTDNVDDADQDPANELQTLSLAGNELSLSEGGGMVTLPTSGDITSVNAGTGLEGGGEAGDVTLNMEVPLQLNGQIKATVSEDLEAILCSEPDGVYGKATRYGIHGESINSAVYGKNIKYYYGGALGTSESGVYGFSPNWPKNEGRLGTEDYAVYGVHKSGNYGFLGSNEYGVYGMNNNGNHGYFAGPQGAAGRNNNGNNGRLGGNDYGVYGEGSPWAGYFIGNVRITGNLEKGSGSFKIDHPLQPDQKYLQHSFVESPDMMNIYNGNVILDKNGEATIHMPDWFEALNMEFRYQLTCIGGFANVYIAKKIENNQFKIAGGSSGLEVSWQVTGVRKDAYANQNRIKVEIEKQGDEAGKYIHPEAFGLPRDMGIGYEEPPPVEETNYQAGTLSNK